MSIVVTSISALILLGIHALHYTCDNFAIREVRIKIAPLHSCANLSGQRDESARGMKMHFLHLYSPR